MAEQQKKGNLGNARQEGFLLGLLVALILFVCVLTVVSLVRSLRSNELPLPTPGESEAVSGTVTEEIPGADTPVFAPTGAVVLPAANEATKQLTSELLSAYGAVVDAESGVILAGKEADTRFDPASMTKIMTLLVACQRLTEADLREQVPYTTAIRDYAMPATGGYKGAGCHWGEDKYLGDQHAIRDLLYGIGVESAADCTVMVFTYLVGKTPAESEVEFVSWMNDEVTAMGLQNTHFDNAIGYESPENYSTASDMAAILIRALQCPLIREILCEDKHTYPAYWMDGGTLKSYDTHFFSTLFPREGYAKDSCIGKYEQDAGTKFSLATATFGGGKTGSLQFEQGGELVWHYSLASFVQGKDGRLYVIITGEVTGSRGNVMKDVKSLCDTYIK